MRRLTTGGGAGLLAAAGAYDEYGYNRVAQEFKGTGGNWCIANGQNKDCFGGYSDSAYLITWNTEWDRGIKEAWVRTPYTAEIKVTVDGGSYAVRWIGNCFEGEDVPTGGTCVWGEYAAHADNGSDVYRGPFGQWLIHAVPSKF